jgi:hypothetical protein
MYPQNIKRLRFRIEGVLLIESHVSNTETNRATCKTMQVDRRDWLHIVNFYFCQSVSHNMF